MLDITKPIKRVTYNGQEWTIAGGEAVGLIEGTLTKYNDEYGAISQIRSYAFYSCYSLTNVNFPNVMSIGDNAFYNCSKLASINFPNCSIIQTNAFQLCSALTSVNFPNCMTVGTSAFINCYKLEIVSFPLCSIINNGAFQSCSALTSVNFPNCITVGNGAFINCYKLEIVSFPNCTTIGSSAFYSCYSLTNVSFPVCETIGTGAFGFCSRLQSISFPNCTAIDGGAFYSCQSLSAIYLIRRATLSSGVFTNTPILNSTYLGYFGSIYVRSPHLSWYQSATNWVAYSSRITTFKPAEATLQENGGDITGSTSLTINLENCEVGDNLIACVLTRSNTTTPDGWTLLAEGTQISATDGTIQNINIYTKVATSTTESITVTQATAGRIYANIVNIKNKTPSVINSLTNVYDTSTQPSITLTKPTNNEIVVFVENITANPLGFTVGGDYDFSYEYGERYRLTMVHSSKPLDSEITITNNAASGQWATIGIELT